jgi:hypothetical protein
MAILMDTLHTYLGLFGIGGNGAKGAKRIGMYCVFLEGDNVSDELMTDEMDDICMYYMRRVGGVIK